MEDNEVIRPQPGFQTKVLSSPADIVFCGGSAGGGKTAALLLDAVRWHFVAGYGAVIFRRSYPEIMMQDGLWDQSQRFYGKFGAKSNETALKWEFPNKSRITFAHLQYEKDIYTHQGAQYAFIGFDEVTHFSKKEFMYLLSRNRSLCGVDPIIRATCNPDPSSWVAEFIAWFIDQETGFPIPERCGQLRYFTNDNGNFIWGNSREEVLALCPHLFNDPQLIKTGIDPLTLIKSMTFIPGSVYENEILLKTDPRYLGNLMAMDEEDKIRLLDGNWKIGLDAKELFPLPKINDIFNLPTVEKAGEKYYITTDHARYGSDHCVIFTWRGWRVVRIDILPLSNSHDIVKVIQTIRHIYRPIPVSQILVDQDGIGVEDLLQCRVFQGASAAVPEDNPNQKLQVEYKNKRTQNYFKASEMVDKSLVSVDLNEVYIWYKNMSTNHLLDPVRITELKVKGKTLPIKQMISDELRIIKRYKVDNEGKKMITPKDQMKPALDNRSPNFADNFMMRGEFELLPTEQFIRRRVA